MSRKSNLNTYQLKYSIRSLVYVEVRAENFEAAKQQADKTMSKNLYVDPIEAIDERTEFAGFDDMAAWDLGF